MRVMKTTNMNVRRVFAGGVAAAMCVGLTGLPMAHAGEPIGSAIAYDAPMGSKPYSVACTEDGNPVVTGYGDGSIMTLGWDGTVTKHPSDYPTGKPTDVKPAGKYMLASMSEEGKIGRWNTETKTWDAYWDMPATYEPQAMAYDGEKYMYTVLEGTRPKIAKTDVSTGDSDYYDMPVGAEPRDIAPGPKGSGKMYVSDKDGEMRTMTPTGDWDIAWTAPGGSEPDGMAKVGDKMMMAMPGSGKIAQRKDGRTEQKSVKDGSEPKNVNEGPSETTWYTTDKAVGYLDSNGDYKGEWMLPGAMDVKKPTLCADGNMWVADPEAEKIYRVRTGQKPVNYQAPWITKEWTYPNEEVKVEDGTWKFKPTDYYHQWQYCTEDSSSSCEDVPGATQDKWTPTDDYAGGYVQAKVWAKNLNGDSPKMTTKRIQVRAKEVAVPEVAPEVAPPAVEAQPIVQALPYLKSIGNDQVAELSSSSKVRKGKKATFSVQFSTSDVGGSVRMVYKPKKGKRVVIAKKVPIVDGEATKRVKINKKYKKGGTVTAIYKPSKGSSYERVVLQLPVKVTK